MALIRWGTTNEQETVTGTLVDIVEKGRSLKAPVVIVVGDVVRLRPQLDWFLTDAESPDTSRPSHDERSITL